MDIEANVRGVIVFDGVCIWCSAFARFMAQRDVDHVFAFVTAQSPLGRSLYEKYGLDPDEMSTNIVIVDGVAHTKLRAFAAAMAELGWPWRVLAAVSWLPAPLSDWLYDRIALNRYVFGRRACPLPSSALGNRLVE